MERKNVKKKKITLKSKRASLFKIHKSIINIMISDKYNMT